MVVVPVGSFLMGSPESEAGRWDDGREGPVHPVTIGHRLAVGVNEVTRGEFARFVSATGRSMGDGCRTSESGVWKERSGRHWKSPGFSQTDAHPVVCVSWNDAQAYMRWLSGRTGEEYRLLSEAEWEYVARAGTETARYWGASESGQCRYANGADASTDFDWRTGCNDGHASTAPVGRYEANGYGLHDVLGNVWEWVEDCWNDSYAGAPRDGSAWTSGVCSVRVLRGGSWYLPPKYLRSALRYGDTTGHRDDDLGFRVARALTPSVLTSLPPGVQGAEPSGRLARGLLAAPIGETGPQRRIARLVRCTATGAPSCGVRSPDPGVSGPGRPRVLCLPGAWPTDPESPGPGA